MSPLAAEQTELLRALARHGVEFVVVGGVAAQVHGWRGATADLDIAVSTDDSNVERLNLALAAVGAGNGTVPAAHRAGVPWARFHTLRHTCAAMLIDAGASPLRLQRWMGHHSAAFTLDTYGHLLGDDLGPHLELCLEIG